MKGMAQFGQIRFNDNNFQERKQDFCKDNNVYNSQLNIIDFYQNEEKYIIHQKAIYEHQSEMSCGND